MNYWLIGIIIGLGLLVIYLFITLNSLIKLKNEVKEAFATMDVYLKKRWDLIPNLVKTVKAYSAYETTSLENIIKARYDTLSSNAKITENGKIYEGISKVMALAEGYPELKSSTNFLDLSKKLTSIEDDIANSRKYYNAVVRIYNNKVMMFPSNIIAKIFGFKTSLSFDISKEERNRVEISL